MHFRKKRLLNVWAVGQIFVRKVLFDHLFDYTLRTNSQIRSSQTSRIRLYIWAGDLNEPRWDILAILKTKLISYRLMELRLWRHMENIFLKSGFHSFANICMCNTRIFPTEMFLYFLIYFRSLIFISLVVI